VGDDDQDDAKPEPGQPGDATVRDAKHAGEASIVVKAGAAIPSR
jgi:hypothetical protein